MRRYYVLLCLLSLFFIFGINSKCKAMTQEDVIDYLQQTYQNYNMSVNKFSNVNKLINSTVFNTYINDTYLEDFSQCIIKVWDSAAFSLYFFDSTTPIFSLININTTPPTNEKIWRINNNFSGISFVSFRYDTNGDYYYYSNSDSNFTYNTSNNNFTQSTTSMFYSGTLNINSSTWLGYNIYNYILPHNITFDGNTYAANVRVGEYYNINNITYKLFMVNDNIETEIPFNYTINYQNGIYGKVGLFNITSLGVLNNANCRLKMYNNTSLLYTSDLFLVNSSGSGGSSGDNGSGGSGVNLSGVLQGIDSVNQSIQQQTQVIYSGDQQIISQLQDNQSFWETTYDTLFSMNSGDVNELYAMVESYFPSGDTPLTIYDTIFGSLNNEPDDFIIRWDDYKLNITWFGGETLYSGDFIAAGSINFSKECRDNETLALIKFWFNTFIVIGFLITYYTTLYNCFCHIIGVTAEEYQEDSDNYKRNDIGFKM